MAFSLYDASVANYLQTLGAVGGFLERGRWLRQFFRNLLGNGCKIEVAPDRR